MAAVENLQWWLSSKKTKLVFTLNNLRQLFDTVMKEKML